MRPKTVSATSINSYVGCTMRWVAEQAARVNVASAPGTFGTALHATLDKYIEKIYESSEHPDHDKDLLLTIWDAACAAFLDYGSSYVDEGHDLLERWVTSRPLPFTVLSREVKETFDIEVPGYGGQTQKVTYILDRCDQNLDGGIEVIDYKSQYLDVSPASMRKLVQPALYACAMRRKYGVTDVAVTYDMLRYQPVTVFYDNAAMDSFETYLANVIKRIWDDNEPRETLNSGCRYCPRKGVCSTLQKATEIGWAPSMPAEELAALHQQLKDAGKGIEALLAEIDEALLAEVRRSEDAVVEVGDYILGATTKRTTKYDAEVVLRTIGDDAIPFLTVGKTALDKDLNRKRNAIFTPEQVEQIKSLAITTVGEPSVTVTAKNPMEDGQ